MDLGSSGMGEGIERRILAGNLGFYVGWRSFPTRQEKWGWGERFWGGFVAVIKSWRPFPAQQEKGDCAKDFGDLGLS